MALLGIYSFPKSGNTWIRNIIAALLGGGVRSVPDLHQQDLSEARPYNDFRFYKHHSGTLLNTWKGEPFKTSHVIHIRRNPLDVFASYLNYHSDNVTGKALIPFESVDAIANTELLDIYFKTFILTGHIDDFQPVTKNWFQHNAYWLKLGHERKNVRCIRYEDMLADPVATLSFVSDWLDLPAGKLEEMIDLAQSRTATDGKFFWKREEKNYMNYLSVADIELFLKYREAETAAIGYSRDYLLETPK